VTSHGRVLAYRGCEFAAYRGSIFGIPSETAKNRVGSFCARGLRIAYSSFLVALSQLADDQIQLDIATSKKQTERDALWSRAANSARIANDSLANLCLVAPESIRALANTAFSSALKASDRDITTLAEEGEELAGAMHDDLEPD
jgi:hypothetical protein